MNSFPCPTPGPACTDPSLPIRNLSSEAPDEFFFIGRYWPPNEPPLDSGGPWKSTFCGQTCESTVSQEDANLCAARLAYGNCLPLAWPVYEDNPDDGPGQPGFIAGSRPTFFNTAQSASFTCPDGSLFTYTVPAGVFIQFNQAQADSVALTFAQFKVLRTRICVGNLTTNNACVGTAFNQSVTVTAMQTPIVVTTYSGALPDGVTYDYDDESITFDGAPTASGQYDFTLQVEDPDGNFMRKEFTVYVMAIDQATLPAATNGTPYSTTLTISGPGLGTVEWSIVGLPTGLSINATTGEITGTPTEEGLFSPVASYTDERGGLCSKSLSMTVNPSAVLLKICDYGTLQPLLTPDPASDASADPEWDGTFDTLYTCFGDPTYFYLDHTVSIQGKALRQFEVLCSTPILAPQFIILTLNFGTTWRFTVLTAVGAGFATVWSGDLVAVSPIGVYTKVAGFDPRATLEICAP